MTTWTLPFSDNDYDDLMSSIKPGRESDESEQQEDDGAPVIRVFTDGSCVGNGKRNAVAGIGVHFPDGQAHDIGLPYNGRHITACTQTGALLGESPDYGSCSVTNQRAELEAIHVAIETTIETDSYHDSDIRPQIHLYSDSEYAINALSDWVYKWQQNDWKTSNKRPVKNRDQIEPIFALMGEHRVVFFHSPAHTNKLDERSKGNAVADQLAQCASSRQVSTRLAKRPKI